MEKRQRTDAATKRRPLIASVATLPILGGCFGNDDQDTDGTETVRKEPPFDVTTVDTSGSEAGTISVPTPEQVQLINFIRTTCPTSRGMLSNIGDAADRLESAYDVGPDGTVHVLTVTNGSAGPQLSRAELADWWVEHDGYWTIGIDESGALFNYHDVTGTPTTIAIDGSGEVHWRDRGGTTAGNVVSGVETALEAMDGADN